MKKIEDIIYNTTREVMNVEDKMRIATIFLFCGQKGSKKLSQLLYTENHKKFIDDLNEEFSNYDVDFSINFNNPNVKRAFFKTLDEVKKHWDSDGFLKALYEGDEFAIMSVQIADIFMKTKKTIKL